MALLIVFLIMAVSLGVGQGWQQLQAGDWAVFGRLFAGFGFFLLIAFAAVIALVAGQANMQARASAGDKTSTEDFIWGARHFYWRFLGGYLLLAVVSGIFSLIFFGGVFRQLFVFIQANPDFDPNAVIPWLLQTVPTALIGFLAFLLGGLFISMWAKLVVADDIGTIPAMLGSLRVVASKFGSFLVFGIISWVVSLVITRIGQGNGLLSLATTVLNLIWTSYYSLTLFIFYRHITNSNPPQPPVTTQA